METPSTHPLMARLQASGPKRILALDGGGIRGALCIGILEKIEKNLAERYENPNFRLSDYYDMIGGTSTGAIIATCLAKGMKVKEVKELYLEMGPNIFHSWKNYIPRWLSLVRKAVECVEILISSAHFSATNLEKALETHFSNETFGSAVFKTGLCIVTKRADRMSPWVMHNHPDGEYYERNKDIFIKDLLRASSAAPSYFKPKSLIVGNDDEGVFIDGGVSAYNNPALILFYICTLSSLKYRWTAGKDNLMITSVGTGFKISKKDIKSLKKRKIFRWASDVKDMFMADATSLNQLVLQTMSYTETPQYINSEFKDLKGVAIVKDPLFTYQRYNISFNLNKLQGLTDKLYTLEKLDHLIEMSHGENGQELYDIGKKFADQEVKLSHFPASFDLLHGHQKSSLLGQSDNVEICDWIRTNGFSYKKFQLVFARQVINEEIIVSITTSGVETTNIAQKGDYIVQNQTMLKEQ